MKFLERQEFWREALQKVVQTALENSRTAPNGKLREALKSRGLDPDAVTIEMAPRRVNGATIWTMLEAKKVAKREPKATAIVIDVKFPSVLEHDITSRVAAIVEAMTLNGFQATGIDEKTGIGLLL